MPEVCSVFRDPLPGAESPARDSDRSVLSPGPGASALALRTAMSDAIWWSLAALILGLSLWVVRDNAKKHEAAQQRRMRME